MVSDILWPALVVLFDTIVFVTMVMLVRLAARDHEREQLERVQQVQPGEEREAAYVTPPQAA